MKPGRNDPCPCGSGIKYKKCCGAATAAPADSPAIAAADAPTLAYAVRCHQEGDLVRAGELYRQILAGQPANAEALHLLGVVCHQQGDNDQAVELIEQAAGQLSRSAEVQSNLGSVYKALGRGDEAEAAFRRALQINGQHGPAWFNLAGLYEHQGRAAEAATAFKRALVQQPDNPEVLLGLGNAYHEQGLRAEALAAFRKAQALLPDDASIHSNILMMLQYEDAGDPAALLAAHREWDRRHGAPAGRSVAFANPREPDRRLRIGYVSADFGRHPVGFFLLPVLAAHDPARVEAYCYSDRLQEDEVTGQLRAAATVWRETAELDDAALAELIRADGIDILIDLAGHTAKNRLPVFARKPAPVQASWAGYAGTTGLAAMDYLISDWQETPAGTDHWYCETIIRLPDDYVCFAPPAYAPPVGPLPALGEGGVTFGCFNNLAKLGEEVVGLWSRLLKGLPDSRLLLVTRQLAEPATVARYRQLFARHGVAQRVEFSPALPHAELLASYGRLDIALDPFPYGGGLTTLESLWMGVPVVTLAGQSFAGRHSASHLTVAGLPELVAGSEDDYLAIATGLASDLPRLAELRRGLRQRVAASPLVDGARFTANLEAAYRQMWHRWCAAR